MSSWDGIRHRLRVLFRPASYDRELADEYDAALVPFLLEGVAAVPELNQDDGIHPNAEGQKRVAENVWKVLQPVIGQ